MPKPGTMVKLNGKIASHLAATLADQRRETHGADDAAVRVLEAVADVFAAHPDLDALSCVALVNQLEPASQAEFELLDELRAAIESRTWESHPVFRR